MFDNELELSARKHLAAIAVLYSVFAVLFHFSYGGVGLGLVLALISSGALMLRFLECILPEHPFIYSFLFFILGASFFVDAPNESDLTLHLSQFSFICGLSLGLIQSICMLTTIVLALILATEQIFSIDKYLVVLTLGALGMYLRWLVLGQASSLGEVQIRDKQTGCKNASCLERDAEQYFNLFERYGIPCTCLVFDLILDESKPLKAKNNLLLVVISLWSSRVRQTDHLYKLSDRRYVCLLPATSKEQSKTLENDIMIAMREYEFPEDGEPHLRVRMRECDGHEALSDWLFDVYA